MTSARQPAVRHPSAEDYIRAVQRPDLVFDHPELTGARFDVHPLLGIPVPASGSTAVVFRATIGGTAHALRFFTREDASTQQRYTAIDDWFTERGLSPDVAACRWVDDAILVNGRRWPMVQMDWVDGHTLDRHVEELVEADDRAALRTLADSWRDLLRRLQSAQFAHGDLQHGNVLVDTAGRLRLVDFDSSWIAPFTGSPPPTEGGHRNYQPENRLWGPWMDTFPGLVIYLSLLALAQEPDQWERFNDGENLLLGRRDFQPPHQTEAWSWLAELRDPQIDQLAARLRSCCAAGWAATGDLEDLITGSLPWWTRTSSRVVPAAPAKPAPAEPAATATSSTPDPATPPAGPAPTPSRPTARPSRPATKPTGPSAKPSGPAAKPSGPARTSTGQRRRRGTQTGTRPAEATAWWQQSSGSEGAAAAGPGRGSAPAPSTPVRPAPAHPAPAAAAGRGRVRRNLSAVAVAVLTWLAATIAITLAIVQGEDTRPAIANVSALIALLPAVLVGVLWARWRRRRRKQPGNPR
ncbi:Phosphotransferase enzyme family protein [Parafrankia irregularis]|uniref:Phosphotransferase enzyme family protein n=1 Tax=Parafrankia irregularis TaxID=795642 RepID=A0A0S4QFV1_9ACTN|nr:MULTISPECIES: phosphotransferase [Parafrankia]MBE3203303.1 phosphotransferase [Parafrankia sp. CH37]CUU54050.1 Phosphotransferase enzyme family protein [Parafrankia irregularis]